MGWPSFIPLFNPLQRSSHDFHIHFLSCACDYYNFVCLHCEQVAEPKLGKPQQESNSPFPKSSKLSPYLRFGCLSVRQLFHRMNQVYREVCNWFFGKIVLQKLWWSSNIIDKCFVMFIDNRWALQQLHPSSAYNYKSLALDMLLLLNCGHILVFSYAEHVSTDAIWESLYHW